MARRAAQTRARDLPDEDLLRELRRTWKARSETVFKGDRTSLRQQTKRMQELEGEYATRNVGAVEPDPWRTRDGARARAGQPFTGGVSREAVRRSSVQRRRAESEQPRGAGEGYETRQGRRRRQTFERLKEGKPFSRHTIGTTGERPRGGSKRRAAQARKRRGDREPVENPDLNRKTRGSPARKGGGGSEAVPARARGGRRTSMTYSAGKRRAGRTTGRGRGVPGLPGSFGRKGGTATRGAAKRKGAANRRVGRPSTRAGAAAPRKRSGGRRPKSGAQG